MATTGDPGQPVLPSGTVTFLFTDVEGSTRLWEARPEAMQHALGRHDRILAEAIEAHRGTLVKHKGEGDSAFAVFATASDAVGAALGAQLALGDEYWPEDISLRVRMAIHVGEAELRDRDYFGAAVNRTARLREMAHGGQIVLSQASADLVRDGLPEGVELVDLGEHRLRDLARPERVLQLAHPALGRDFPPLRSLDAYPTNLPAQTTSFVGRQRQLAEVAIALGEARVVTLTGVGGVGKTRLALQVAADVLPRYRDGAWITELAPIVDPAAVLEVVAASLGVTQRQGHTLRASLLDFLRAKRLLLMLDNCEHLLEAVARFLDEVIRACPHVAVLATSREGLSVGGERVIPVPSLELPRGADTEAPVETEAVRLFVERAAEAKAGFALSDKNQAAVIRLCRRLDGIPLAIELAAARVRSLTPAELAERLDERFRLLAGGPRTAVERHQTLRRAIDWSYDLLDAPEQKTLNHLAVFAAGFDLDAAEAVLAGDATRAADVVDVLGHLVDKSLVIAEDHDGVTRYRLLETIRSYAQDRLEEGGDADAARRRHAEHYVAFAAEAGYGLRGRDEVAWTVRVEAELDNLRAAHTWSVASGNADLALRLVAPLALNGTRVGYASSPWTEPTLALPDAPAHPLYPEVLAWAGWVAMIAGDLDRGIRLAHEALDAAAATSIRESSMCRVLCSACGVASYTGDGEEAGRLAAEWLRRASALGDDYDVANALTASAAPFLFAGDTGGALVSLDEALAVARRLGNPTALSYALMTGGVARLDTDSDRALELLDEAREAAASVGNQLALAMSIGASAFIHIARGNWLEAAPRALRAAEHFHGVGDSRNFRTLLNGVVTMLAIAGADETAALLYGAAHIETVTGSSIDKQFLDAWAALRHRLGEDRFTAFSARGATMDDDELVVMVRQEVDRLLAADEPSTASG
jgi:predicted ATPase/class 3 adenylate cyclase